MNVARPAALAYTLERKRDLAVLFRELATLRYRDGSTQREMRAPKGDVLHQFREDVRRGQLPTVSWIIPPENFSDP